MSYQDEILYLDEFHAFLDMEGEIEIGNKRDYPSELLRNHAEELYLRLLELFLNQNPKLKKIADKGIKTVRVEILAELINLLLIDIPMIAWNPNTKQLDIIESVCVNGDAIQFNIEEV